MAKLRITMEKVAEKMKSGENITFVDVRPKQTKGSIPGAMHIPAKSMDEHLDEIPKEGTVVTYCT